MLSGFENSFFVVACRIREFLFGGFQDLRIPASKHLLPAHELLISGESCRSAQGVCRDAELNLFLEVRGHQSYDIVK